MVNEFIPSIGTIVTVITGFGIVAFAIWNASRKITIVEKNQDAMDATQSKDITTITERIHNVERDLISKILEQRAERKEEIAKWGLNNKEDFQNIQNQLDSIRSDVKDMSSRITVVDTKANDFETDLQRTCNDIDKLKSFFADWIQRVEDRIKESNNYIFRMASKKLDEENGNG